MSQKSDDVPRKLKDAIALFESSGRPQEGDHNPRKDNVQYASPVVKAGLFSEAQRLQNGLPRSKNAGLTVQPTSDYRSQLTRTGAEHCTDQNDFRAHLKPVKCKPNIALDIGVSADSKTEKRTDQVLIDSAKVSERMAGSQGLGKVHTSSQGKASEAGSVSPNAPGKDFKLNLAKMISAQNSTTPRTVFPTGQITSPPGKLSTNTMQSQSSTTNSPSVLKSATMPFSGTPEPLRAQRKPPGHLAIPKLFPDASGSASNHPNLTKTTNGISVRTDSHGKSNFQSPLPQKTTPTSSQTSPDSKPTVTNKPYTIPLPPMPKTGINWKVIERKESGAGNGGNWKSPSTHPSHSHQVISVGGKKYRLLPPPAANRDTCPRKPRRPPSVDLTQFIHHASGTNEISGRVARPTARPVPPSPQTNSKPDFTARPVSLIPEWTEEDEAREASLKAAQQGWVAEDDDNYEIADNKCPKYVNATRSWLKQTEDHTTIDEDITDTRWQTNEEQFDAGCEMADKSDDSDYENIDSYK